MKKSRLHTLLAILAIIAGIIAICQLIWYYWESITASPLGRLFRRKDDDFDTSFDEDAFSEENPEEISVKSDAAEPEIDSVPQPEVRKENKTKTRRGYISLEFN